MKFTPLALVLFSLATPLVLHAETAASLKADLEKHGWEKCTIIQSMPDFLRGDILTGSIGKYEGNGRSTYHSVNPPVKIGTITANRIVVNGIEYGRDGIVTAMIHTGEGTIVPPYGPKSIEVVYAAAGEGSSVRIYVGYSDPDHPLTFNLDVYPKGILVDRYGYSFPKK